MHGTPLDVLTRLVTLPERIVAGIMSGTSVDAIDVALLRLRGSGEGMELEVLHYRETLFSEEMQHRVFANMEVSSSNINDICLLHTAMAHVYADALRGTCAEAGIDVEQVHLIGMHGQTLRHLPDAVDLAGIPIRSTIQIGSAPTLATLLGVPVVSDFRAGDMVLGGQGAPLVPRVDWLLFRDMEEHRVILNIGGMSNITVLRAACTAADVVAFDTGPGNVMVDALMRRFHGREFDEDGMVARSGRVNPDLIGYMMQHAYFAQRPPKSTGREMFGEHYLSEYLALARDLGIGDPSEIIATAAECTVRSIRAAVLGQLPHDGRRRLFVAGGGARNRFFMDGLRMGLPGVEVERLDALGLPSDAREAVSFAVLANEWLMGNPGNMPSATGARREALLGSLALPA